MSDNDNAFDNVAQQDAAPVVLAGQQLAMPVSALASVEQSRAVAEVQAALVIAASRPRDELSARDSINKACQRINLAKGAVYTYNRGGTDVTGPTIRLAEALARSWGNLTYGFREIGRSNGTSEVEAWAWDLQTNTKAVRQFTVKHWRDTRSGGYALKEERDIYELMANMAQRRVRACILEIIPGDIVDDALEQCEKTTKAAVTKSGKSVAEVAIDMVESFKALGVSRQDIEKRLGHRIDSIQPGEILGLSKVYNSIKEGWAEPAEYFKPDDKTPTTESPKAESRTEQVSEALSAKRNGAGKAAQAPQEDAKAPAPASAPVNEDTRPQGPNLEGLDLPACRMAALEYWTGTGWEPEDAERMAGKSLPQWTRKDVELVIGAARTQRANMAAAGL